MHTEVTTNSFTRCKSVFNNYSNGLDVYPLNSQRILYVQKLNKYSDTVEYEVAYSNNPNLNTNYTWEYT
ncbi:hypothetical protein, partial [Klebsiella pneumoniae]|uniref:hypothetical protein n=1 Tax=Klebsiella pneumoniae TaxID=573 RepID=UPI001D0F0D15